MAIYRESGPLGKWRRQAVGIKQMFYIVADPALDGVPELRGSRRLLNLREALQNKTGMEVIDKIALAVGRIIPRAIGILRLDYEVYIPLCFLCYGHLREI